MRTPLITGGVPVAPSPIRVRIALVSPFGRFGAAAIPASAALFARRAPAYYSYSSVLSVYFAPGARHKGGILPGFCQYSRSGAKSQALFAKKFTTSQKPAPGPLFCKGRGVGAGQKGAPGGATPLHDRPVPLFLPRARKKPRYFEQSALFPPSNKVERRIPALTPRPQTRPRPPTCPCGPAPSPALEGAG